MLGRDGEDGCAALKQLIEDSHETPAGKSRLKREAFGMFRNLVRAKVLDIIPVAERDGPMKVGLNVDLQEDFSLNHALGIYLLEAIPQPDRFTSSLIRFTYFGEIMRGLLIKLTLFIGSCD